MDSFVPRGFYAIADVDAWPDAGPPTIAARARAVLRGNPCCLQLRAKGLSDAQVCELGHALAGICHEAGVPFCLNDRVDLALLVGADIVHVGQDDLPLAAVRRALAAARGALTVGVSTHTLAQAREAVSEGADYIGFGPVFATRSKSKADPTVGPDQLAIVVRTVPAPVVAIGGITVANVAEVVATGVAACAVISDVWRAQDPGASAQAIARAFVSRSDP